MRPNWWQVKLMNVVTLFVLLGSATFTASGNRFASNAEEVNSKLSGAVLPVVIAASPLQTERKAAGPVVGFKAQTRFGYTSGDQWEPAVAADRFGHVYVLYMQYDGVPGCGTCPSPTLILLISADHGTTWASPKQIAPPGTGQYDAQIVVDTVDGRTVYASWLQNNKSATVVAKSTDFGATWSVVIANSTKAGVDKDVLAVRGTNVYVAYNHAQTVWVSASHDGGASFKSGKINQNAKLGWSLAGGGTVAPSGQVYFSWAGYTQNGGANGPVNLYVSSSADGGTTWTTQTLDVSGSPPDCSAYSCGWAYLGAQITTTSDAAGTLYALWNAGSINKGPERIYFAKSLNAGATWSTKVDVSNAPVGVNHAFPSIVAGSAGDVRIGWMDTRAGTLWNTYYRRSSDGGTSWSVPADLSPYVAGYSYIQPNGFSFPYGDYFEMDIDEAGTTHVVWGEGLNYDQPGSIWYSRGE